MLCFYDKVEARHVLSGSQKQWDILGLAILNPHCACRTTFRKNIYYVEATNPTCKIPSVAVGFTQEARMTFSQSVRTRYRICIYIWEPMKQLGDIRKAPANPRPDPFLTTPNPNVSKTERRIDIDIDTPIPVTGIAKTKCKRSI